MNPKDIANTRLLSQQIAGSKFTTVRDLVGWMGAIQAQDYAMAKWAIGARLTGSTTATVETALNNGEIIRTHLMRPTWHFVAATDIYWMLELTAPQIRILMRSRDKELELSEKIYKKSNSIIKKALADGKHLTREALMLELEKAKIATDNYRSGHLMLRAEMDGIVCSGAIKANKQTYTLLEDWVPKPKTVTKDEALKKLATKYFSSHCPATLNDFIWWSGLPVRDGRNALEMIKKDLVSENVGAETYWMPGSFADGHKSKSTAYLLPAFDEYLISYKDRGAALQLQHQSKAFSINGIFRPIIVMNGQVTGLWKRSFKKDSVIIETNLFKPPSAAAKKQIDKAAKQYARFLGMKASVVHAALS
ncbi:MAG: winged helix DNA-binding domain-containing protein [Ferruginibacter sp.]